MRCAIYSYEGWILGRGFSNCEHCKKAVCSQCVGIASLCKDCSILAKKIPVTKGSRNPPAEPIATPECSSWEDAIFELQALCLLKRGKCVSEMWIEIRKETTSYSEHTPRRTFFWWCRRSSWENTHDI